MYPLIIGQNSPKVKYYKMCCADINVFHAIIQARTLPNKEKDMLDDGILLKKIDLEFLVHTDDGDTPDFIAEFSMLESSTEGDFVCSYCEIDKTGTHTKFEIGISEPFEKKYSIDVCEEHAGILRGRTARFAREVPDTLRGYSPREVAIAYLINYGIFVYG